MGGQGQPLYLQDNKRRSTVIMVVLSLMGCLILSIIASLYLVHIIYVVSEGKVHNFFTSIGLLVNIVMMSVIILLVIMIGVKM
jgi:hypothetical protein